MRLTLHGSLDAPAVGMLSTWDPFLPAHARQLAAMRASAAERGLSALALVLDPPPALLLNGEARWPVHSDLPVRIERLRAHGVAVGAIAFAADDLAAGAQDFFDVVCAQAPVAEFWLKHGQTIGSGPRGNARAVRLQGVRRKMVMRMLLPDDTPEGSARVRACLAAGAPAAAAVIAGEQPAFTRPPGGVLRLAWRAGTYAAHLTTPGDRRRAPSSPAVRLTTLHLRPADDGMCRVQWPSGAERVVFVRGPGDAGDASEADASAAMDDAGARASVASGRTPTGACR